MATQIQHGEKILFIGDSITDCGRRDPQHKPFGCGYVSMFRDMLLARDAAKEIELINCGIGGNTVEDLRSRWEDDALSLRPDWLSIKIGINDCNRWLSHHHERQQPANYREDYTTILQWTRETLPNCRLLLITPFFISTDRNPGSYRARVLETLPEYISIVQDLSAQFQTRLFNPHEEFQKLIAHPSRHASDYCPEPVHPYAAGHLVLAEGVYQTLSS